MWRYYSKVQRNTTQPGTVLGIRGQKPKWRLKTSSSQDEEIDEQELEAHYTYMEKIQEVPNADSGTNSDPLEHLEEIKIDDKLRFVEESIEIMDREVKKLKRSWIPIVKDRWNSRRGPEFTWEQEDKIKRKYPCSELGSELTFLAGSELELASYRWLIFRKTSNVPIPIPDHLCLIGLTLHHGNNEFDYIVEEALAEGTEGALHLGPERPRVYSDLSPKDKERYNADIRATNILLQGLPKDIYSLINHYTDAKEKWDNHKGETIHDYYVRFAKLVNDMCNIKMTMSRMQLNSKFVNNMLPEWGRFVIAVKLNRGLRDSNYDQLYAYLKQHEVHANENKMMLERFTQLNVDPLALMSNVSHQPYNSQSSRNPPSTYVPPHFAANTQLDSGFSLSDNLIENLTNTLALLT
ncbi:hypothetical protein Tco_1292731 [Tanacetum coccineum]